MLRFNKLKKPSYRLGFFIGENMHTHYIKSFHQLSVDELYDLLKLRVDVFVVEQTCPYPELDNIDRLDSTFHLGILHHAKLTAYARVYRKDAGTLAIGRVVVAPAARGKGTAHELMNLALELCKQDKTCDTVYLSAQVYLKGFYASLGFNEVGEEYLEDGIPHQDMYLKVN